jgi:uncharacterized protein
MPRYPLGRAVLDGRRMRGVRPLGDVVAAVVAHAALAPDGIHGVAHWARVLENGRRLAGATAARLGVVELFAVLHDSRRESEGRDLDHGRRAAAFVRAERGRLFDLEDGDLELLVEACAGHVDGLVVGDATVGTCWDADRLDLGRVGIAPRPALLCTSAGRAADTIAWAESRSRPLHVPGLVASEWGIDTRGLRRAGPGQEEPRRG